MTTRTDRRQRRAGTPQTTPRHVWLAALGALSVARREARAGTEAALVAAGRASQRSIARSYNELEPAGTKWHAFKWLALAGNYLLMGIGGVYTGFKEAGWKGALLGGATGAAPTEAASN